MPETFGDTILVNGTVWPYLEVEPRKYRFRILNASNARFYHLRLTSGQPFVQVGTDGGFLFRPVTISDLTLAPAERADVIIDFSGRGGQEIILNNDALAPFPDGGDDAPDPTVPGSTGQIMQFRVNQPFHGDGSFVPPILRPQIPLPPSSASRVRDLSLNEDVSILPNGDEAPIQSLLGSPNPRHWEDPVTENPRLGSVEIWRLINTTGDAHPVHIHQVQFQVLDRQPFDVDAYLAYRDAHGGASPASVTPYLLDSPIPPDANEIGRKDTVRAKPGYVTRVIMQFGDFPGRFVWHCHILEHEDNDMMRPMDVLPR